ncbi:MAG: hypothetical protein ACI88A_001995 [Paraglaciecola sp.]|jgi:hypothetical protein
MRGNILAAHMIWLEKKIVMNITKSYELQFSVENVYAAWISSNTAIQTRNKNAHQAGAWLTLSSSYGNSRSSFTSKLRLIP